ncbi:MAG: TA0938 family protein [Thermoprotei archaeon]
MKLNRTGCALCDATWGEYYDIVQGERMLFCCNICAAAFKNMLTELEARTGWTRVDELVIEGDNRVGRTCVASAGGEHYSYKVRFHSDGRIMEFQAATPR